MIYSVAETLDLSPSYRLDALTLRIALATAAIGASPVGALAIGQFDRRLGRRRPWRGALASVAGAVLSPPAWRGPVVAFLVASGRSFRLLWRFDEGRGINRDG